MKSIFGDLDGQIYRPIELIINWDRALSTSRLWDLCRGEPLRHLLPFSNRVIVEAVNRSNETVASVDFTLNQSCLQPTSAYIKAEVFGRDLEAKVKANNPLVDQVRFDGQTQPQSLIFSKSVLLKRIPLLESDCEYRLKSLTLLY